jgi:DNA-binding CsgD family transcriptional regulator
MRRDSDSTSRSVSSLVLVQRDLDAAADDAELLAAAARGVDSLTGAVSACVAVQVRAGRLTSSGLPALRGTRAERLRRALADRPLGLPVDSLEAALLADPQRGPLSTLHAGRSVLVDAFGVTSVTGAAVVAGKRTIGLVLLCSWPDLVRGHVGHEPPVALSLVTHLATIAHEQRATRQALVAVCGQLDQLTNQLDDSVTHLAGSPLEMLRPLGGESARASLSPIATGPERIADLRVLSSREREVAELLRRGWKNAAMAEALTLTPGTVRAHVSHVCTKLGLANRTQAILLVPPPAA